MKGNPNPSPATRFKKGQSANPGGKSSKMIKCEKKAAQIAATIRLKILSSMMEKLEDSESAEKTDAIELLSSDALRLFKDSEDRAYGTPKATQEITGQDGGPIEVQSPAVKLAEVLDAIAGRKTS